MRVLAWAAAKASAVGGGTVIDLGPSTRSEPRDSPGRRHALAVALEGRIRSAFGAGVAPNARVLALSSPQLIVNPYARAANAPVGSAPPPEHETLLALSDAYALRYLTTSLLAFKNILDWATFEDDLLACFERTMPGQAR